MTEPESAYIRANGNRLIVITGIVACHGRDFGAIRTARPPAGGLYPRSQDNRR